MGNNMYVRAVKTWDEVLQMHVPGSDVGACAFGPSAKYLATISSGANGEPGSVCVVSA